MKKIPMNQVDYYDSFPEFLDGISKNFGDKPAISYFTRKQELRSFSYRELVERARSVSAALLSKGFSGKNIAIVSENSYDWIVAYLAITAADSTAVCVDIEQSDDSIREMLTMSDSAAVFVSGTYLSICQPLLQSGGIQSAFLLNSEAEVPGAESLQALCSLGQTLAAQGVSRPAVSPQRTAAMVFTSGTTSRSKLVMLSNKNILQNVSDSILYISAEENVFSSLPFYHTYGMTCAVLGTLVRGAHLYINGDLKTMMRDLHLAQPDSVVTVPLMVEAIHNQIWFGAEKSGKAKDLRKLLKLNGAIRKLGIPWQSKVLDELRQKIVGNLHIIVSGGAHLSREITEEFMLLGILILQGYGITECSPLIATNCNHSYRMGSVGHVLPSCQLKVVEEEIWVKGPSVMQGYYNAPELTDEAFEDGWFKTGDIGYQDRDGFLFLTGRKKNLIVFKNGKKVSPEKIEELIRAVPLVKDVLVHGTASGNSADDVKLTASIFPDPLRAEHMTSYEILEALQTEIDSINAQLPTYQQVQLINIREREFAKTASQKIKRHMV